MARLRLYRLSLSLAGVSGSLQYNTTCRRTTAPPAARDRLPRSQRALRPHSPHQAPLPRAPCTRVRSPSARGRSSGRAAARAPLPQRAVRNPDRRCPMRHAVGSA
eukprot:7382859-Prymnesium_polylepis.2